MYCNRRLHDACWQLPHRSDAEDCNSGATVPIEYADRRQENEYVCNLYLCTLHLDTNALCSPTDALIY